MPAQPPPPRWREPLLVVAGSLGAAALWTWPLVARLGRGLPELGDSLLNAWILAWGSQRLPHVLRGVWDAPAFFPFDDALAFSEHLLGITLLVAPAYWLTSDPVVVYNVAVLIGYAVAAGGMYLLARALTGSPAAASVAGAIFMTVPYRAEQIAHLQVLTSGWMPVTLWALHRYFRDGDRRMLGIFAAGFALQGLSNGYFLYFTLVPVVIVSAFELVRMSGGRAARRRAVGELAMAGAVLLVIVLPVALAYLRVRAVHGFERTYGEVVSYSADLGSYLYAGARNLAWPWLPGVVRPEAALFPGLTALALAVAAPWAGRGSRVNGRDAAAGSITIYATIAAVAFVLSLGPEPTAWGHPILPIGPYRWLMDAVPGMSGLRVPSRLGVVVHLSLAVLAAFGVARLMAARSTGERAVVVAIALTGAAVDGYAGPMRLEPFRSRLDLVRMSEWLAPRPPGGVLHLPFATANGSTFAAATRYQLAALRHEHPVVNGYSGFRPALQGVLEEEPSLLIDPAHAAAVAGALRRLGLRYVVVHRGAYRDREVAHALERAIRSLPGGVGNEAWFADTIALELAAPRAPSGAAAVVRPAGGDDAGGVARVRPDALTIRASHNHDVASLAVDGDPSTRWFSRQPQDGTEWVELRLDRPRALARIRLQNQPGYAADFPRRLVVETSADGRVFDLAFEGAIVGPLIESLARNPRSGAVDVALDGRPVRVVRLRQTGTAVAWSWAINELAAFETRPGRSR